MELNVKHNGNRVHFEVDGIIDTQGAESLAMIFNKLDTATVNELILNFKNVRYLSSAGVGKLLKFYTALTANGGRLRIVNDTGPVHEIFTASKMDTIFLACN
jgi:anti-anti-sigma factor